MPIRPTRVKRGTLVPAAEGSRGLEGRQRGPTLMAGSGPASRGQVRVFSPDRRLILRTAGLSGFGAFCLAWMMIDRHNSGGLFLCFTCFVLFAWSLAALKRPCFITMDDEGIGITTMKQSVALGWGDIRRAKLQHYMLPIHGRPELELVVGNNTHHLNLVGYTREQRQSIFQEIILGARLVGERKSSGDGSWYGRPLPQLEREALPSPGGSRE